MSNQPAVTKKDINTNAVTSGQTSSNTSATSGASSLASRTALDAQAPMFADIWGKTQKAVDTFAPFSGDVIAAPNTMQQQGVGNLYNAAGNVGTNAGPTADIARKVASGYFLDPTNDPTFQGTVHAALAPITRALQEQVLPGIVDKSIRAGGTGGGPAAYGGASQDLQENQAVQNWSKQAADTTASLAGASRTAGMNLTTALPGLNTSANAEALAPASTEIAAGGQKQALDQSIVDNLLQKWNMSSTLPFLQQASNLLTTGGFGNTSGTSTGTNTGTSVGTSAGTNTGVSNEVDTGAVPNMLTQWLQGLTGGAGVANSLFGTAKGGTSAASGLMAALSAICDRRLKYGISQIGTTFDGLPIYRYYFHGTGRWEIGFMADEVEREIPEAVREVCGIKTLDYEIATQRAIEMSEQKAAVEMSHG